MMMLKFHGFVKAEWAVAVGSSAVLGNILPSGFPCLCGSSTSFLWVKPRSPCPIPFRCSFYFHMTIRHGHHAPAAIVAKFRSAPIGINGVNDQSIRLGCP